jgi:glycosyltransferase involved in cell wall biosynthesis
MFNSDDRIRSVLHVADSSAGGGAEQVYRATVDATQRADIETTSYIGSGSRNPLSYIFSWRHCAAVKALIGRQSPDVVHLHNFYHVLSPSVLFGIRRARRAGWRGTVVFTAHDYHIVSPNSGFQRFARGVAINLDLNGSVLRPWWRYDRRSWVHSMLKLLQHVLAYRVLKLSREIDLFLTPSDFTKAVLESHGHSPVKLHRNAMSNEFSSPDAPPHVVPPTPQLAYFGRLSPEKGLVEAVSALDELLEGGEIPAGLEFHIYGLGTEESRIREASAKARKLKVVFHGFAEHEQLGAELRGMTAFILPSRWYEVSPLSILEAAGAGLPVVVPDQGGLGETARHTTQPFLYQVGDRASFGSALRGAIAAGERNTLVDPSLFTLECFEANLLQFYETARLSVGRRQLR